MTKEGVKFSTAGDIGTANIVCRQNKTVDKVINLSMVPSQTVTNLVYDTCHVCKLGMPKESQENYSSRDGSFVLKYCAVNK